jgi:hypothetical protein
VRPSATTIESIAISSEHEQEDDECGRETELELAVLQVLLRERVEVVLTRLLAGDGDLEARHVGLPDCGDHVAGGLGVGDEERHELRVPVGRHDEGALADLVEPTEVVGETGRDRAELSRVGRVRLRPDDDGVDGRRLSREGLRPRVRRPLRLGVVRRSPLGRQRTAEQHGDSAEGEHRGNAPDGDRAPWVPRAGERDGLCRNHGRTPLLVTSYSLRGRKKHR